MVYREVLGEKISALGLGLMRLPIEGEDNAQIDEAKTREMVDYAMQHGVNYYDTAYNYHRENSERVIGKILQDYPRDKFYLASKFPGFKLENIQNHEQIFEEQLAKCQVDYFDFYLFHTVSDDNIDNYLNPEYGLLEYMLEQKRQGRIRHLGFSTHASLENMQRFFDAWGEHMEFAQIQLNWLDWTYQQAREKVDMITRQGMPIWIMEPLRGGSLAALDPEEEAVLKGLRPEESIPAWSFRFLQRLNNRGVILSGMSNLSQLKENIEIFSEDKPLNDQETEALLKLAAEKIERLVVPCTSCQYCEPVCPKGLPIHLFMEAANELAFEAGGYLPGTLKELDEEHLPHNCIACHRCEKQCPQGIKIASEIEKLRLKIKAQ